MKCTSCPSFVTKVKQTQPFQEQLPKVLRTRQCPRCNHSFQTIEIPDETEQARMVEQKKGEADVST